MELTFSGPVFSWRGPAPYHFVSVPEEMCADIAAVAGAITYGWGMIPATLLIGDTTFTTSLWPKDGGYLVPLKDAVRRAEGIELEDVVAVTMTLDV